MDEGVVFDMCIYLTSIGGQGSSLPYLDGQHDVRVTLEHFHSIAVTDVLKAHPIG